MFLNFMMSSSYFHVFASLSVAMLLDGAGACFLFIDIAITFNVSAAVCLFYTAFVCCTLTA